MRNKFPVIFLVLLFPLVLGWAMARAADQQSAGGFKIVLSDGSLLNGAVSFVVDLDTQYGQIKIPSSSLISARFDAQQQWADVRLNGAELKMKYKPDSSDLNATTSAGPLKIALTKVVTIDNGSAEALNAAPPQANVQQPPVASAQQPPQAGAYQYPYQYQDPYAYQYAQPAPYYGYNYSYPYYGYGSAPYYGNGWPYYGFGFGWWPWYGYYGGYGRGYGGFHGGYYGGGFHGGYYGGGSHGGGSHGGGHR
ncbi:MAG: hypothetical protein ACLQVA_11235 [Candidatus Brocadiia bacterium]